MRLAVADYYASLSSLQCQIDYVRQAITAESAQRSFRGLRPVYDPEAFRSMRPELDFEALTTDRAFIEYATLRNADQIAQQQWWTLVLVKAKAMCEETAGYGGRPCAPRRAGTDEEIFGVADVQDE